MARMATKRKSESALPSVKSKYRKTSAQKDDALNSAGDESSDQLFVAHEPVAPKHIKKSFLKGRKSEPVKRAARVDDEYEADEGRSGGQDFLAIVKLESVKKKKAAKAATEYMDKFEDKIDGAEESLKKRLQDRSIEARKQDSEFTETFSDAYAASRPLLPPANGEAQPRGQLNDTSFASLYDRTQEVVEGAKLIVEKFEYACQKTSKIKTSRLIEAAWIEENEQSAKLLMMGHQFGMDRYEAMLAGSHEMDIDENSLVVEVLYPNIEGDTSITWGGVAKKGGKVWRKLTKVLVVESV